MQYHQVYSFNAGEFSRRLESRSDLEKYFSACRKLENFIALPYGGVANRPGTEYIAAARFADRKCRLIPFRFSTSTNFIVEVGDQYLRFYSNGQQVSVSGVSAWTHGAAYTLGDQVSSNGTNYVCIQAHTSNHGGTPASDDGIGDNEPGYGQDASAYWHALSGTIFELPAPWLEPELFEIQFLQIKDVVYLVHPAHRPRKLVRLADDRWSIEAISFDRPALLDENAEKTRTLTCSHVSGSGRTLTASGLAPFTEDHVGSDWEITHRREDAFVELSLVADAQSAAIQCRGVFTLETTGTWAGKVRVQQSFDSGSTWETIRSFSSSADRNAKITDSSFANSLLRLDYENEVVAWADSTDYQTGDQVTQGGVLYTCIATHTSEALATPGSDDGAGDNEPGIGEDATEFWAIAAPRAVLEVQDPYQRGIVRVTGYSSATEVTVDVIHELASTDPTDYWAQGAWSGAQGYPRTIALHENRVWYGGTAEEPLRVWGSAIDDYENYQLGVNDSDAVDFVLASTRNNLIQWMVSQRSALTIGTTGGEFTMSSRSPELAISASTVSVRQQSSYGGAFLQGLIINDSMVFLQRLSRKIREYRYDWESDSQVGRDITLFAEHITMGSIQQMDFSQQPNSILWGVTADGSLIGLTYERDQEVLAWHRHRTEGAFESVAVIPGENADEVWVSARRSINGNTVRYLERLEPYTSWHHLVSTEDSSTDETQLLFQDAGLKITNDPASTSVSGLDHLEGETLSIRVDGATHPLKIVSGGAITLDYPGTEISVGLAYVPQVETMPLVGPTQIGSSKGRKSRIHRAIFDLYRTRALEFSTRGADAAAADWERIPFRNTRDVMDAPPPLRTEKVDITAAGHYDFDVTLAFRQAQPQPATILALTLKWDVTQTI